MEPAASVKKRIERFWLVHEWPITVPRNVGAPPIKPMSARKRQLGSSGSPLSGPMIAKPSVALWSPNPITSTTARLVRSCAADWPIARPSEKLCNPMPVAMKTDNHCAADSPGRCVRENSATEAAPGPSIAFRCRALIQAS